jgi:uracil-DNA glycosylase
MPECRKERGQWFTRDDGLRVMVTLHPSALLRMEPAEQASAFTDWVADLEHAARDAPAASRALSLESRA